MGCSVLFGGCGCRVDAVKQAADPRPASSWSNRQPLRLGRCRYDKRRSFAVGYADEAPRDNEKAGEEQSEDEENLEIDYMDVLRRRPTFQAVEHLKEKFGETKLKAGGAIVFFGVMFGAIAAVALTNSIDTIIGAMQSYD